MTLGPHVIPAHSYRRVEEMSSTTAPSSPEHRTVSRVTGILEFVASSESAVRMVDIVAALAAPRSSLHGLVHGLVSNGYLTAHADGTFELGAAINALRPHTSPFETAVRSGMEMLNLEFDETVTWVVRAGDSMFTNDAVESSHAIRYTPLRGLRRPLYPTSAGKCFLAHAPRQFRNMYVERTLPSTRERHLAQAEIQKVIDMGYAINAGDTFPDLCAVSVPLFDGTRVAGVITVAGPISRTMEKIDRIVQAVLRTVSDVERNSTDRLG